MRTYLRTNCRLCKSKALKKFFSFPSSPIGDDYKAKPTMHQKKYPLDLYVCEECNFVQLGYVIDPKKVYGDYLYVTKTSSGLKQHFYKFFQFLKKKKLFKKNSKVLEIGSNDGTFQKFFHHFGCETLGIDPAKKINEETNLKNISDFFSYNLAKKISNNKIFDLILANNVVANIDDLDNFFKGVVKILTKKGFFVMETFSLQGVVKNNLIDNIYHEHLSYFTIKPLLNYAKKFGLKLFYAKHTKVKGGSLRLIFTRNKFINNDALLDASIKKEKLNKVISFKSLQNFNNLNEINDEKISKILLKLSKGNKKIFGFGASVGSTTLAYRYKIFKYLNFIFDDDPKKWDLFLPGSKIKVVKPKKIAKNSYVFLFAWRYKENILSRHIKKLKGSKLIIPLPSLKITNLK